jgi:predicted transcriptional regulator
MSRQHDIFDHTVTLATAFISNPNNRIARSDLSQFIREIYQDLMEIDMGASSREGQLIPVQAVARIPESRMADPVIEKPKAALPTPEQETAKAASALAVVAEEIKTEPPPVLATAVTPAKVKRGPGRPRKNADQAPAQTVTAATPAAVPATTETSVDLNKIDKTVHGWALKAGLTPAVDPQQAIKGDTIICLEDGHECRMMKRHLSSKFKMSPEEYRRKWGLPNDYPVTAPNYSDQKRAYAKATGLGTSKIRGGRKRKVVQAA